MRWSRLAAVALGLGAALWPAGAAAGQDPAPPEEGWYFLPERRIFSPLLADPRWPHFSLAYNRMIRPPFQGIRNAATISLGEHVGMVEYVSAGGERFGIGLQPAVFGLF